MRSGGDGFKMRVGMSANHTVKEKLKIMTTVWMREVMDVVDYMS